MKKHFLYGALVVLLVAQIISLFTINDLKNRVDGFYYQLDHLNNRISSEIGSLYSSIDNRLNEEAALIESADVEIGPFNPHENTALITFTLTPKEIRENTVISLNLNGEVLQMEQKGIAFSLSVPCDIFSDVLPKIVIDENGIKKVTQDYRLDIGNVKDFVLPSMYPQLTGTSSFENNIYTRKGYFDSYFENATLQERFKEMRLRIEVDGELISDEKIPIEQFFSSYEINEKIPMTATQACTITLVATDDLGFVHHYIVDTYTIYQDIPMSATGTSSSMPAPLVDSEIIYSADGTLLWPRNLE